MTDRAGKKEPERDKTIAIITARGGSKRIPGKNKREFCKRPILEYSIEAALSSQIFDTVMVSTDEEEIAEIAVRCGAQVPFYRTADTANDFATTADVLEEVLGEYRKRGEEFDALCCIYPTAPFLTGKTLCEAYRLLQEQEADSVVPVVRFEFPPQRGVVIRDGRLQFQWPEYALSRSQDLTPFYHDAGQFYFLRAAAFAKQRSLIMEKTVPLELPQLAVQDIDCEEDWKLAELKFQLLAAQRER